MRGSTDLHGLLGRNPAEARRTVEALLDGPVTFTPSVVNGAPRFDLCGTVTTGAMFINQSDPNGKVGLLNELLRGVAREMELVARGA